eukprot:gene16905-22394_t
MNNLTIRVGALETEVTALETEITDIRKVQLLRALIEQSRQEYWIKHGDNYRLQYQDKELNENEQNCLFLLDGGQSSVYGHFSYQIHSLDKSIIAKVIQGAAEYSREYETLFQLVFHETVDSVLEVWKGCNCVHPWIEDETTAREIEQIYQPSNPPHIVFVLADDLGWNDIGYQSTYQSWATPAIDLLASEGIKLKFYFTHDSCTPSRGALLTGRYSIRLGLHEDSFTGAELPITEATLAEELKSAGYRTNMVGKWHLGSSSELKLPHNRGFDYTYGYYNGYIDYWSKKFNGYTDLHENGELVTDDDELSSDIHSAYLFQSKVENVISDHVENYPDQPMFLYYSLQLVHFPYEPPAEFVSRCQSSDITTTKFCGQTLMLDEVIANLTCALKSNNMIDNTILIFASDNGGTAELNDNVVGNSVPFRGHKFSFNRGGISAPAFIHSPLIPESARGSEYNGLMHVTDWLPTLMGLATEGAWSGSYIDNAIDGVDMWDAIITGSDSPKQEIVNYISESGLYASYQYVEKLEAKINEYSSLIASADNAATSKTVVQLSVWNDCDCVKPWVDDTSSAREIEQIYNPSNPPHIVFVLADDLGWNDIGYQSTYQSWATPAIDLLASEGIKLKFYFTHDSCTPSRGALLTGRYSIRLGLHEDSNYGGELRLSEITLAEELKTAGYRTNMVGKWHIGTSSELRLPHNRGFDYTYGYYNGYIDYWTKEFNGYNDLHENGVLVFNDDELSTDLHSAYLFQSKAENVIANHAKSYPDQPMFLYYSLQLVHFPYQPPEEFLSRCLSDDDDTANMCGLTVMLDEVIANLTCALKSHDMIDNTILIFASDNGGADETDSVTGNSVPFRGHKFSFNRGGISAPAFIHSPLIPESARGSEYNGLMHVTDWLPTLMGLATEGAWSGSYIGNDLDGVDMWEAIITGSDSPRVDIVNYISASSVYASYQYGNYKYDKNVDLQDYDEVEYIAARISEDYDHSCSALSLVNDNEFVLPAYTKWHFENRSNKQVKQSRLEKFSKNFASFHWTALASLLSFIGVTLTILIYVKNRRNVISTNEHEMSSVPLESDPLVS